MHLIIIIICTFNFSHWVKTYYLKRKVKEHLFLFESNKKLDKIYMSIWIRCNTKVRLEDWNHLKLRQFTAKKTFNGARKSEKSKKSSNGNTKMTQIYKTPLQQLSIIINMYNKWKVISIRLQMYNYYYYPHYCWNDYYFSIGD